MKKVGDLTVNDGKGLYDNEGLCESLLADMNNLPKMLMTGQYIQFCAVIQSMAQRIINLKQGIKTDLESKDKIIEELKKANEALMQERGEENGG